MTRRQRRALEHALRKARRAPTDPVATGATTPGPAPQPTRRQEQHLEARDRSQPWTSRLTPLRRRLRRILGILLAAFAAISGYVAIYASRPLVSMSTSTQDDACSFTCSHFLVTNSSRFYLYDVTVRCFPQKLVYSDEFTLVMTGLDTINRPVTNLESGEPMTVKCGYMLRHFMQPGVLLLSHGDPFDNRTKIIRIPVNDQLAPILDAKGNIVSLPATRGGRNVELGRELPLSQADVVFSITFTSQIVPFHVFHQERRFQLLLTNGKLDWQPVPLSDPPLSPMRTRSGFELQMSNSIDALEKLPDGK